MRTSSTSESCAVRYHTAFNAVNGGVFVFPHPHVYSGVLYALEKYPYTVHVRSKLLRHQPHSSETTELDTELKRSSGKRLDTAATLSLAVSTCQSSNGYVCSFAAYT